VQLAWFVVVGWGYPRFLLLHSFTARARRRCDRFDDSLSVDTTERKAVVTRARAELLDMMLCALIALHPRLPATCSRMQQLQRWAPPSAMMSAAALEAQLSDAAQRVHIAAAEFSPRHRQAAVEYTDILLRPDVGVPDSAALMKWKVPLFDGPPEQYSDLLLVMNELQRLVTERRASASDRRGSDLAVVGLLRLVTGLDAKIEAKAAEVRQQAAAFGSRHARAAVEWTERLVSGSGPSGNVYVPTSNAALLDQRVELFAECQLAAASGAPELSFEVGSRCEELRSALDDLLALKAKVVLAEARAAGPVGLTWKSGDPMPPLLREWGCDDDLWGRVGNKRALVRLANTDGGEARCRLRLARLRQVVGEEEASRRAADRAARRAARTGAAAVLTPDGTSSTTGRSPSETTAADAPQNAEGRGEPISSSTASAWGPKGDYTQSEEYRAEIPATLREWGCDEALWSKVKKKNALRRLANAGDEEHGRRRIAALKAKFAEEIP
jgi:hypothetical protein